MRGWNQIIYDPVQKKVLMWMAVSGCGDPWSNALWAYDTATSTFERKTWTGSGELVDGNCAKPTFIANAKNHPGDRHPYHQMTYDTTRGRLWIYGGVADNGKCDGSGPGNCDYVDTWYYDSKTNTWACTDTGGGCNNRESKMTNPGHRVEGAMQYDAANDVIILFGSLKSGNPTDDTWQFSPAENKWARVATQGSPSIREADSIVYDSADRKLVMFGGSGVMNHKMVRFLNDIWIYDAARRKWSNPEPADPPPGARFPPMAYDSKRNLVVYYQAPGSVWAYSVSENRWTRLNVKGGPAIEVPAGPSMAYDVSTDTFVLVYKQVWQLKLLPSPATSESPH